MKKITGIFLLLLVSVLVFLLGFDYKKETSPNEYYQVYLDKQLLGTIDSKKQLEKYIDAQGNYYKEKYGVKNVYAPSGLEIRKVITYDTKLSDVKDIYNKIKELKPFTIKGSQLTIKNSDNYIKVYALNESIFSEALENTEITFVGEDKFKAYKEKTQSEIDGTGTIVKNIYISTEFTIKKKVNIPVDEKIYTSAKELTQFLIFGNNTEKKTYKVKVGDTINSIAFDNEISVNELLLSNPAFTNSSNLLFPGQDLVIGITDPQVNVVVVEYVVEDIASNYKIEEKYDSTKYSSYEEVVQEGVPGLDRVSKTVTTINGLVNDIVPESKLVLTAPTNKIIVIGTKKSSGIGSLANWGWPTDSGWTLTSDYAYRIHPIYGTRELHTGIDISGTGAGSPIYAVNNGVVVKSEWYGSYGNCIIINHNNGYYTLYGHMSKLISKVGDTVERGQQIGCMGKTGTATGNHLHFEVWQGGIPYRGGTRLSPWTIYR